MKIYDKEMYQKEQWIILGFVVGYFVHNFEKQEEVTKLQEEVKVLQRQVNQIS